MTQLSDEQGALLVKLARETLITLLGSKLENPVNQQLFTDPVFKEKRGVFVTLKKGGQLRGCVGSLNGSEALVEGIRHQAENAALYDTRFSKVQSNELEEIELEISILTEPQPLEFTNPEDLEAKLRPNIDGVILSYGRHQSTFLPQVWDQLPKTEDFLGHLSIKAGLPREGWKNDGVLVAIYQVQHYEERTK